MSGSLAPSRVSSTGAFPLDPRTPAPCGSAPCTQAHRANADAVCSEVARRQSSFPPGMFAPYQVRLDNGKVIFAPIDDDRLVKLLTECTIADDTDKEPPIGWRELPHRTNETDRANFVKWNRRPPFNPRTCNPDKVTPRDQFDSNGKAVADPNQELKDRTQWMCYEEKCKHPGEFLNVRLGLHGALEGDLVWVKLNDGFTAAPSYEHFDSAFFITVPTWPNRMNNDYHVFSTALRYKNWHLRDCLDETGVTWKKQWMYSNYCQSATVVEAALIRARLNPKTQEVECFYVHRPQPVYQSKDTNLVEWAKGVCKPPKGTKFHMVKVETLGEAGKVWFGGQVAALKRERTPAPSPSPSPGRCSCSPRWPSPAACASGGSTRACVTAWAAPTTASKSHVAQDLLNVASGTFDPAVEYSGLYVVPDIAHSLDRLCAFYYFGIATSEKTLTTEERRRIVQFQEEVHAEPDLNKWDGETVLKGIGVMLGGDIEHRVRARCDKPTPTMLLRRVEFLKSKKKEFLDFRKRCISSGMDPRDVPLAMAFIEPDWLALPHAAKVSRKFL